MTADELLEVEIEQAFQRFIKAAEPAGMRIAIDEMRVLIAKRSPTQIERMETAMGLR